MNKYVNTGFFVMAVFFLACKSKAEDKELAQRIVAAVTSTQASQIRLDTVVRADWDHVYILYPYTSSGQISDLKSEVKGMGGVDLSDIQGADWKTYLIFTKAGGCVSHTSLPRNPCCNILSDGVEQPARLSKAQALFNIHKSMSGTDTVHRLSIAK